MDDTRFDALTRSFAAGVSRRTILGGVLATVGLGALSPTVDAARKKKKKKKKLQLTAFGCVDVGKPCRGKDSKCCSGICQGKKPKKGKKDKSKCVAHHQSTCTAAHRACTGNPQPSCNPDHPQAICYRTTGQAGFCGLDVIPGCIPCRKDADCHQQLGEGSACVVCSACPDGKGMCIPPGID